MDIWRVTSCLLTYLLSWTAESTDALAALTNFLLGNGLQCNSFLTNSATLLDSNCITRRAKRREIP